MGPQADANILLMLEEILRRARTGEVVSVSLVAEIREGAVLARCSGTYPGAAAVLVMQDLASTCRMKFLEKTATDADVNRAPLSAVPSEEGDS